MIEGRMAMTPKRGREATSLAKTAGGTRIATGIQICLRLECRLEMASVATRQESGVEIGLTRVITLIGLAVFAYAGFELISSPPDLQWVWLAVVTVLVVSRLDIHIPKTCGTLTLSDTFVFISLALYGIDPAVVFAGGCAALGCRPH